MSEKEEITPAEDAVASAVLRILKGPEIPACACCGRLRSQCASMVVWGGGATKPTHVCEKCLLKGLAILIAGGAPYEIRMRGSNGTPG